MEKRTYTFSEKIFFATITLLYLTVLFASLYSLFYWLIPKENPQDKQMEVAFKEFDERLLKVECEVLGGELLSKQSLTEESIEKVNSLGLDLSELCTKEGFVYIYNYKLKKWIFTDNKELK